MTEQPHLAQQLRKDLSRHLQGHFDEDRNVLRKKSARGKNTIDLEDYDRRLREEIVTIKGMLETAPDAYQRRKLRH